MLPAEVIKRYRYPLANITNGPTEAFIKRTAYAFRNFTYYRIRTLLYAREANWNLLATITPSPRTREGLLSELVTAPRKVGQLTTFMTVLRPGAVNTRR